MASRAIFFFFLLFLSILFLSHTTKADDEEDRLLAGINSYRASLNLSALTINKNAGCFAEQLADQFEHQPCSNTTGANTVPGTETQFGNYEDLLDHCHLNISNTKGGAIMPACVPNLEPNLVLSNYTQSQYNANLNDSQYTGVGISAEEDWIVVVLTTNTPNGSFVTQNTAGLIPKVSLHYHLLSLLLGFYLMALMS